MKDTHDSVTAAGICFGAMLIMAVVSFLVSVVWSVL